MSAQCRSGPRLDEPQAERPPGCLSVREQVFAKFAAHAVVRARGGAVATHVEEGKQIAFRNGWQIDVLGEQVDHITDAAFRSRITGMEQEATAKAGRPVRYHVQTNGREVVLLAVPLG